MTQRGTTVRWAHLGAAMAAAALCACLGCAAHDIDATYGKRRGAEGEASVNGTGVLADMFRQAGHRVGTRRYLSPSMDRYGVVVWAPDDFQPPGEEYLDFFERWLADGRNRTLVYIGRDFDAAIRYWEAILPAAPVEQRVEVARRLAQARARHDHARAAMPADKTCRWFRVRRDRPVRHIGGEGRPPTLRGTWCRGQQIDPARLDIHVAGTVEIPAAPEKSMLGGEYRTEVLLAADDRVLAWRITSDDWPTGQIIVVVNGSFLLNLPLVRREHRKLAGKLIGACPASARVAFLESGPGGPPLLDHEPGDEFPTGFEALTAWPIGAILMHFLVLGIVYVFARGAVFGRPHELPPAAASDFGKHIMALGQLLARTENAEAAHARLAYYRQKVRRESGGLTTAPATGAKPARRAATPP